MAGDSSAPSKKVQIAEAKKASMGRSPGYPFIPLEAALQRATLLYKSEKVNFAHYSTVMQHWGYTQKSGSGRLVFAAVKSFGLIDVKGEGDSRSARVSDAARRVILDERPNSEERRKLLRDMALRPKKHRELWTHYEGVLPSDTELLFQLKTKWDFSDGGAADFLAEFRKTLAFAKVDSSATVEAASTDEEEADDGNDGGSGRAADGANPAPASRNVSPPPTPTPPPQRPLADGRAMVQVKAFDLDDNARVIFEAPMPTRDFGRVAAIHAALERALKDFLMTEPASAPVVASAAGLRVGDLVQ